ncbi:MAG: PLP-dependent aminotransferase family protein [Oceanobacter sp.]
MTASAQSYRYQQLEHTLLQGMESGRWRLGERLPSIRDLCREFSASKATVQHALQRLEAQGLIEARPKSGFYVTLRPDAVQTPELQGHVEAPRPVNVSELLLDIMRRSAAFDILPQHHRGDLPPGIVALNRSIGRALRRQRGEDYLYYDDPAGLPALREQLLLMLARRGCSLPLDQLAITSGCQHALFLALMASCEKGDVVAVESPGFYGVMQLLEQLGLQVIEIPASASTGISIAALEQALEQWPIRACIVSPAYSTPGGALMPTDSRQRLLALAEQHDMAIIEDDIYADTAFAQQPDPLKALDTEDRVILCSSFSKSLSRDLRLGWIAGGRWHQQILRLKIVTQLASSRYLQQGVADFIADGSYASHLKRQKYQLRQQRDQLLAALRSWNSQLKISAPEGGLAVWVELADDGVNTLELYPQALEQGIVITPGPLFSASGRFRHCLRLSFAHDWNEQRLSALARLRGCVI